MGNSCGGECKEAKARVEGANRANRRSSEPTWSKRAAEARALQEKLEVKFQEMVGAKDMHIGDLKREIEEAKQAKLAVDNDVRRLQQNIMDLQKEHAKAMLEGTRIFAQTIEKKDQMVKENDEGHVR